MLTYRPFFCLIKNGVLKNGLYVNIQAFFLFNKKRITK